MAPDPLATNAVTTILGLTTISEWQMLIGVTLIRQMSRLELEVMTQSVLVENGALESVRDGGMSSPSIATRGGMGSDTGEDFDYDRNDVDVE